MMDALGGNLIFSSDIIWFKFVLFDWIFSIILPCLG